jgi:hypothetical protein
VHPTKKRTRPPSQPSRPSQKEASAEAVNAVAYATKHHSEWFWQGTMISHFLLQMQS